MQETPIFFPIAPSEFLKTLRTMIEEVVTQKMADQPQLPEEFAGKTLLKPSEVCTILRISKHTLYVWMREGRRKSFTIRSRRYFARTDIEKIMGRHS